ncbi:MAG: excinuclease ABC subunit UvrA [Firmicutes bacterium]|nr:excinuclease ABC subunit UvrA [Bacillota bacterium]
MGADSIVIRGARQHNLKNIDVVIPRGKLVVITGLSGSGKSSLAFDTIYAEGQRRYVESLSAYARQFLGQMDKPDVDSIDGLSPAISIDQKTTSRNPRSTVGTVTEVYDYLRLLYARIGIPHCPQCGRQIAQMTVQDMVDAVMSLPEGSRILILAPVVVGKKGEHRKVLEDARRSGFQRVRVNGEVRELTEEIALERYKTYTIEIVVDRLIVKPGLNRRLTDSVETAMKQTKGLLTVAVEGSQDLVFSENMACPDCGISFGKIEPRMFSFNSPFGACPDCTGLGFKHEFDPDLVFDWDKSIRQGAVRTFQRTGTIASYYQERLMLVAETKGIDMDAPMKDLPKEHRDMILYGTGEELFRFSYVDSYGEKHFWRTKFEGVMPNLDRRYRETTSDMLREEYEKYMGSKPCDRCKGARLKPEAIAVTVGGTNIVDLTARNVGGILEFLKALQMGAREKMIAGRLVKEINERLNFLVNVGLDYITLDRPAGSLSGGEAQRIRLATQIGSGLTGVLYILDEPSIGLHQRDNRKLIETLKRLRDIGNTVIVVEHDEEMIREADEIIDMGPGAGLHGGYVIAQGRLEDIMEAKGSVTGDFLSGRRKIAVPLVRRPTNGKWIGVRGATEHNLKDIDVDIPLGMFVCVTGVSGSGKSTLINEILYRSLSRLFYRSADRPGAHREIVGLKYLDKVINIDQSAIGRTPRSNPATYTGLFDDIRSLFSEVPEARARGYKAGRFSFNVKGGRCEACRGDGIIKIEMHFLPDVYVPCEQCGGRRYNRETLEILYKGKSIADVLEMSIEEGAEFFRNLPSISRRLDTLVDVGLGYMALGQAATTLSGGEAQRVKLATELSRRATGRTLYLLDEPTTGLHFADIEKLLDVLHRLVEAGNSVLVIEHNLDVIKTADWIIDLGPEGGEKGGRVIAAGTPEQVAAVEESYTGQYLRDMYGITPAGA